MIKTRKMLAAEDRLGGTLEDLIPSTYNDTGSLNATATKLGIPPGTLYLWMAKLGLSLNHRMTS